MNRTTIRLRGQDSLGSAAQLHSAIQHLLNAATQRQIWLLFLDDHGRLIEPIMPMNDHPEDPHELHEIEDLGRATFPETFVHRAREIAALIRAGWFVIVWERPGNEKLTGEDLDWVRAFALCSAVAHPEGAKLRALFLLHDHGLRAINHPELV